MGLESLQGCRDKAKLKWLYKLACMEVNRYSHKFFRQIWNSRGRQRKSRSRVVDNFFSSLGLHKAEWVVEDIQKGECSLKGFLSVVGESIDEWESRKFKEELDSKVKFCCIEHSVRQ